MPAPNRPIGHEDVNAIIRAAMRVSDNEDVRMNALVCTLVMAAKALGVSQHKLKYEIDRAWENSFTDAQAIRVLRA